MIKHTTLCYIERDGAYLLLYRNKKNLDVNGGKWVGIGGHLEAGETPDACLLREVREETGLVLTAYRAVGDIAFLSDTFPAEIMHLYHVTDFEGELLSDCSEGTLAWVDKKEALSLPMWEGDRLFLTKMEEGGDFFHMILRYEGEALVEAKAGGRELLLPE